MQKLTFLYKAWQNTCIHKITHAHTHRNSKNGYLENDRFFHWQPLRLKQFEKLPGMFVSVYHPVYCTNITAVLVGLLLQECFTRVLKGHITLCIALTLQQYLLMLQECFTRVLKGHINLCTAVFPSTVKGNIPANKISRTALDRLEL